MCYGREMEESAWGVRERKAEASPEVGGLRAPLKGMEQLKRVRRKEKIQDS